MIDSGVDFGVGFGWFSDVGRRLPVGSLVTDVFAVDLLRLCCGVLFDR